MKLKVYKKKKISTYIFHTILIIIISLIISLLIINYFSKKANKILLPIAEEQTRKVVTMVINNSCNNVLIKNNLYTIEKNSNDEIQMINYNSFEITKLINEITSNIENDIKEIELGNMDYYKNFSKEGGVIAEIPFGVIFGNSLLNNVGPKIKLRLNILGDIVSNIETEVKPYGINNAYVELRVTLTVNARILLPFVSEKVTISNVIPLSMNIVEGNIPKAYISSYK